MGVEPLVGRVDQRLIERRLVLLMLVAGYQHIRFSLRIEGEGRPSDLRAVVSLEAQLLHVGMLRSIEGVDMGSRLRPPNSMPLVSVRGLGRAKLV